jgi:protein SCO1/2
MRRLLCVALAAGSLALSACGGGSGNASVSSTPPTLHGAVPGNNTTRPEFVLRTTAGQPYDFAQQTSGKVTLLYFGYTHCPDECPTSMADVASALRDVPASVAAQVRVVFVTTDPWRDTARVLRHWLDRFSPAFIGLVGTPSEIVGAEIRMGMPISRREAAPKSYGSGKYSVSHFAAVLAYGRDDRLATVYPAGVAPSDIAADLKVLVKE